MVSTKVLLFRGLLMEKQGFCLNFGLRLPQSEICVPFALLALRKVKEFMKHFYNLIYQSSWWVYLCLGQFGSFSIFLNGKEYSIPKTEQTSSTHALWARVAQSQIIVLTGEFKSSPGFVLKTTSLALKKRPGSKCCQCNGPSGKEVFHWES